MKGEEGIKRVEVIKGVGADEAIDKVDVVEG